LFEDISALRRGDQGFFHLLMLAKVRCAALMKQGRTGLHMVEISPVLR
jgi:hypothetical protein